MCLCRHDAATEDDSLRSGRQHERVQQLTQGIRNKGPHRMIGAQMIDRATDSRCDRVTRGDTLYTGPVIAARPGPVIARYTGDAQVTELPVVATEHRPSAHDRTNTDARADGDI